uniref:Spindle and kinetochore associated complex subunit 2 n=1 Tax=Cebus imitator TaxID=2715852 RepID=A0A2K5PSV5_CEBIM
ASKVGHELESPETPGSGGWTRIEFPPPAPKGAATVVSKVPRGKGSRKLSLIWITFNTGWNMKSRLIILIQLVR